MNKCVLLLVVFFICILSLVGCGDDQAEELYYLTGTISEVDFWDCSIVLESGDIIRYTFDRYWGFQIGGTYEFGVSRSDDTGAYWLRTVGIAGE